MPFFFALAKGCPRIYGSGSFPKEVGTPALGPQRAFRLAPLPDRFMVALKQNLGNRASAPEFRAGIGRRIQPTCTE